MQIVVWGFWLEHHNCVFGLVALHTLHLITKEQPKERHVNVWRPAIVGSVVELVYRLDLVRLVRDYYESGVKHFIELHPLHILLYCN